jgi:ABC-type nitrate/sulfonate/bicarbonate transport system substrate-binding protein
MLGAVLLLQALTVAVSGPPTSAAYLPIRVAAAEGYFTREGLSVTVRPMRGPVEAADALVAGGVDLAATSLEALARRASGVAGPTLRLVLGLTAAPPLALLGSPALVKPPRSVAALKRQTIGLAAPGPDETWLVAILARTGLTLRAVDIQGAGERDLLRMIETGEVAAALVAEPFASRLLAETRASLLADLRTPRAAAETLDAPTVDAAVFARADRRPDPAALAAFTRAVLVGEQRIAAGDAAALGTRLPSAFSARAAEIAARVAAARKFYLPEGVVSVEQVRASLALIRARMPLAAASTFPKPDQLVIRPPR